jgi:hypothetical protein
MRPWPTRRRATALQPLYRLIERHVLAQLLRLARSRARASRAASAKQSFTGILRADAYSGDNELYDALRAQRPITPALCWGWVCWATCQKPRRSRQLSLKQLFIYLIHSEIPACAS